ncbi:MAG: GNAT family N-acetyltransferase [Methylovulum sp.]|nr:GNAT family N-acetyltransferase [Methylovulum sp.]
MAIDARYRGGGIGSILLDYSIALIRDRIAENVGCRFVVTDAKSEAVRFYEKQGFVLLDSEGNQLAEHRLMFLDFLMTV